MSGRAPLSTVLSRRNFASAAQAASLLATALFVLALAARPGKAHNLLELCESALLVSLAAFAWCFLLALWLHAAIARVERVDVMGATLRTSAAAVWFAPATILLGQFSPLFLPAALLLVVNATRVLYSEWKLVHPEEAWPSASPALFEFGSFPAVAMETPVLPRHFGPALAVSAGFEGGAVALLFGRNLLAAACFALAAAVFTVFAISAGVWRAARPPSLPQNIFGVALTIVLSALLIVAGVSSGSGGFGFGFGSGSGDKASFTHPPPPEPGAGTSPAARRQPPPSPPDATPVSGDFPGVILWPDVNPVTVLIAPVPSSPHAFATAGRSLSIPFGGEYWFFRFPFSRPPAGSFRRRGNPASLAFSTTDRWPLDMEAHQKLDQAIDLACCSAIQLEIRNGDRFPGTVSLELFVVGDTSLSLGAQPISSSPDLAATPIQPVGETLTFAVPPLPSFVFREFRIVFRRLKSRADKSARIAIDRFVLAPRGAVVAEPM